MARGKRLSAAEKGELFRLLQAARQYDRPDLLDQAEDVAGGRLPQWALRAIEDERVLMAARGVPLGDEEGVLSLIEVGEIDPITGQEQHLGYRTIRTPAGGDPTQTVADVLSVWEEEDSLPGGAGGSRVLTPVSYYWRAAGGR